MTSFYNSPSPVVLEKNPYSSILASILRCPICFGTLEITEREGVDGWVCINESCQNRKIGAIQDVQGQPVLIDFEQSIVSEESFREAGGGSQIDRQRSAFVNWMKERILYSDTIRRVRRSARRFAEELRQAACRPIVLVIGGGTVGLGMDELINATDLDIVSFDVYASPRTHFVADANRLPIADSAVDGVWIQYVLEHVLDPGLVVREIARVLKDGGVVFSETPFLQQVHEGPVDFSRFTHSGHRYLFSEFDEIESGVGMGPGAQLLWALEYTIRGMTRSRVVGKIAKFSLSWLRLLDYLIPDRYAVDCASSTYFFGRKRSAEKIQHPSYIIKYYRGADQSS